ncbi:MAG: amidase [Chloroflexi bacterium]|nr:amidase [Chloroflexota bacterium]
MTTSTDLDFASAEELAALVRRRALSPRELMAHTLDRIEALNPRLNAFVELNPERALAEASAQSERIARGEDLGPLGGLPFGVKDLEDVGGLVTSHGSRAFRDHVAPRDSVQVERLRRAGAIPIGKTNTPEFGHTGFSANELFGATRNPWNLERTPGGSSGGSAAAVAGGLVAIATASDGGGSVRIPACFVGAYGLKTSFGRVPIGPSDFTRWIDVSVYGPITRTVRDAALILDQVAGYHPADPCSLPHPGSSYLRALEEPLAPLRIAYSPTLGATHVQSDVAVAVEQAVTAFTELGHAVDRFDDPIPQIGQWWTRMTRFEGLAALWDVFHERPQELSEPYRAGLEAALALGAHDFGEFARGRAQLNDWCWRLFERYDLLLTPTMPLEAFAAEGPLPSEVEGQRYNFIAFTAPFNFSGHPAATVRAGRTASGMPCGLQIVGPRHRDDLVLRASLAYEAVRPWAGDWPRIRATPGRG